MRGGARLSEALAAGKSLAWQRGRDLAAGGAGPGPERFREPTQGAGHSWEEQGPAEGEPGRGRARWHRGKPGTARGGAWQGGAGPRGPAERGCGRLFRAVAPPLPPSPPVPRLERGRQLSKGKPGSLAGELLSGSGRRGGGGPRPALLSIAVPSRPFSPCPTAGTAPRPRRWSARTAGPSGQRRAVEAAGPRRVGSGARAGSQLSGCILGKAPLLPQARHWARPRGPGSAARPAPPATIGSGGCDPRCTDPGVGLI